MVNVAEILAALFDVPADSADPEGATFAEKFGFGEAAGEAVAAEAVGEANAAKYVGEEERETPKKKTAAFFCYFPFSSSYVPHPL